MSTIGAFAIVSNEDNKVLLVRRKDFPIWDLPGGRVEINESIADCAIRETQEETGYVIKINKKLGEYQRPEVKDVQHIYLGEIVGGEMIRKGNETSNVKKFHVNRLPIFMVPHRKEQIKDYKKGSYSLVKVLKESKGLLSTLKKLKSKARK